MFKLKKIGLFKRISITIVLLISIIIIAMILCLKNEEQTEISRINLNKLNDYQDTVTVDGIVWEYDIDNDGNAINVHYKEGELGENVTIPQALDGHTVVKIEYYGKEYSYHNIFGEKENSVKTVNIPEGVISIGRFAFYGCSSLTSIKIPEGVTSIGEEAFYGCSSLRSIDIPEGVTSIGIYAFRRCSSLTSINIPGGVTSIGDGVFLECSGLTNILVPEGVTSIGRGAFEDCSALTEINIPEGVTSIGECAFYKCSSITSINIPEGVTSIGNRAFYGCSSITSINIPEGVTSIGGGAFNGCSSITSINIPEGVTSIEREAFYGCSSLTSINLPEGVTSIGSGAFEDCSALTEINIPEGVTSIGESAFYKCSSITSINIPEGVTNIGKYSFCNCSSLTSINIPEGVTSIGSGAFYGCSSITSINIPEGVTSIENSTFRGCSSLTEINIPEGVTNIREDTFYGCSVLTSINIPEGVTSIGSGAFEDCSVLTEINIPEGVTSIENSTFRGCSALTEITIPEGVTSIGEGAFMGCINLKSINIPEGVTNIGDGAFRGCRSIKSIKIPEGVTSIEKEAFYGCSSLTSIKIPEGVTSIGEWAFTECSSITSINIPEGVTSIGEWAFASLSSSLTTINIPKGVTSIGQYAFYNCYKLTIYTASDYVATYARNNNIQYVLDKTPPTIKVTTYNYDESKPHFAGDNIIKGEQLFSSNGTYEVKSSWVNYGVTFKLYATDALDIKSKWRWNKTGIYEDTLDTYEGGLNNYTNIKEKYVSLSGDGYRKAQYEVSDAVGNTTVVTVIVKIERTQPELTIGEYTKEITKEDIVLNLAATDSISGLSNIKVNSTNVDMNNGQGRYTVTKNGTYEVIATDNAGNMNTKSLEINNIDKERPTLEVTGNPTEWTKEDIVLNIRATDNLSGISNVKVNGSIIDINNGYGIYTVTENGTYEVVATDIVGNESTEIIEVTKIDKEDPTLEIREEKVETGVKLEITAIDEGAGVDKVTVNGEEITITNNKGIYSITEEGTYEIIALDKLGNRNVKTYKFSLIELEIIGNPSSWTKEDVVLNITSRNGEENINNVTVNGTQVTMVNGHGTYTITENGIYEVIATNSQGNVKTEIIQVTKIDKEVPTLEVTGNPSNWTKEDVTLNIETDDGNGSGIESIIVTDSKGNITNVDKNNKAFTTSTNDTYTIKVTDKVGNIKTKTVQVTKIDKEEPTLEVTGNPSNWTKEDVTLNIETDDGNGSGIESIIVTDSKGNATNVDKNNRIYTTSTNDTYTVKVTDKVGNIKTKIIQVTKIDKEVPTLEVTGNPSNWTKEDVTLNIETDDGNGSGIESIIVTDSKGNATNVDKNNRIYTTSTNDTYIVKVTDKVGNIKTKTVEVTKIDREGPEIEIIKEKHDSNLNLEITVIDKGVGSNTLKINGQNIILINGKATYSITEVGEYELVATDRLGNSNRKTVRYSLIDLNVTGNPSSWTKEDVVLNITSRNGEENINNVTVNGKSIDMKNGEGTYTVIQNGTYEIEAKDSQENVKTEIIQVTKIDKEVPTLEVTGNPSNWTKEDVTLNIETDDGNGSGIESIIVTDSKGNVTNVDKNNKVFTTSTNGTYTIKVRDNVGNEKIETVEVTKIMKMKNIRVKQQPQKTEYLEGENFDPTGMKIEVLYDNGTREEISNYEITNGNNLSLGKTSVTISYTEKGKTEIVEQPIIVREEKIEVDVKKYEVVKDNGINYIEKIIPNTSIETLKENIETKGTVEIYKNNERITDNSKLIATGMEIVIKFGEQEEKYVTVVTGDITGNGKMGIGDLSKFSRYAAGLDNNLTGAYLRASDIVKDGKYGKISDILKMSRVLAGMDTL